MFHVKSGSALIAMDEAGRRWCVWEWECSCGRTWTEGHRVEMDQRTFPVIGSAIATAVIDQYEGAP